MKKAIIYVVLVIVFLLLYLLQAVFFTSFTIAGVMPNLLVILMLFIGLYMGRSSGIIYGILFGILVDIWIGRTLGVSSVCLALIGFLSGVFDKNFSKDSRMTVILMGAVCTIIYEVANYLLRFLLIGLNVDILLFIKVLLIEVIYNIILTIIIYPLIKGAGIRVEDELKGDNIYTRYF